MKHVLAAALAGDITTREMWVVYDANQKPVGAGDTKERAIEHAIAPWPCSWETLASEFRWSVEKIVAIPTERHHG